MTVREISDCYGNNITVTGPRNAKISIPFECTCFHTLYPTSKLCLDTAFLMCSDRKSKGAMCVRFTDNSFIGE